MHGVFMHVRLHNHELLVACTCMHTVCYEHCNSHNVVVIWCDMLGNIQWRKNTIWRTASIEHSKNAKKWRKNGCSGKFSLLFRSVRSRVKAIQYAASRMFCMPQVCNSNAAVLGR